MPTSEKTACCLVAATIDDRNVPVRSINRSILPANCDTECAGIQVVFEEAKHTFPHANIPLNNLLQLLVGPRLLKRNLQILRDDRFKIVDVANRRSTPR